MAEPLKIVRMAITPKCLKELAENGVEELEHDGVKVILKWNAGGLDDIPIALRQGIKGPGAYILTNDFLGES